MGMYKVLARGTRSESCSRYSVNTGDGKREEETINTVIKNQDHDEAIN